MQVIELKFAYRMSKKEHDWRGRLLQIRAGLTLLPAEEPPPSSEKMLSNPSRWFQTCGSLAIVIKSVSPNPAQPEP
jgi:hypothetical protein